MCMIKKLAVFLAGVLLVSGCGQQKDEKAEPPAEVTTAYEKVEENQPYCVAADDLSNLKLKEYDKPIYDKHTVEERRELGLPLELPSLDPPEGKIAYLTFDDGPDQVNTPAILDILADNQVKATFYVLGKNVVQYPDIVQRIWEEGHALGNHSFSHDYGKLYSSPDNYLVEMEATDEVIFDVIGMRPLITRAPGGTLGNFTPAYFTAIKEAGYAEHDWNVSSADTAPGNPTAQDFIDNIAGETNMDNAIILMHCSSGHEETVKALPEIINILRSKGYSFGVVTPMTMQPR